jgi:hypothetical protein
MKTSGIVLLVLGLLAGLPAFAQSVISAQSGLIHYTEGQVFLGDSTVQARAGQFPQMKGQNVLRTEEGRAEILLNPGAFLRIGENSSIRMVSGQITNARLELLSGSVVVEIVESLTGSAVTIDYRDAGVSIVKRGIYRVDSNPAGLRVFDGEAVVLAGQRQILVRKGSMLPFDGTWAVRKFNPEDTDALDRWSSRRAEYLSVANVSAARSLELRSRNSYMGGWLASGWAWNPYYGMYSFVPYRSTCSSPYGYRYYSPRTVTVVFQQPQRPSFSGGGPDGRSYNPSLGYSTIQATSTGNSGTMAVSNSAPTTQGTASSAAIPRDTGSAGGRTR